MEIWKTLTPNAESIDGIRHIQRAWDTPVAQSAYTHLETRCDTPADTVRLKVIAAPHAGDWLNAPPVTAIGLRLSDEAIRVDVGFRLGCITCQPHICICCAMVNARWLHGLSCRKSGPRHARHSQLNDLIWRAVKRAQIQATKEPIGLSRIDGKRPDGATLIPWKRGKPLTWDVTVPDTYAASHLARQQRAQEPQNLQVQYTCHDTSFRSNLRGNRRILEDLGTLNHPNLSLNSARELSKLHSNH